MRLPQGFYQDDNCKGSKNSIVTAIRISIRVLLGLS